MVNFSAITQTDREHFTGAFGLYKVVSEWSRT